MESSPSNDGDDQNDTGWSQSQTVETLTLPPPPSLSSSPKRPGDDSLLQMPPLSLTSLSLSSYSNSSGDDSPQMSPPSPRISVIYFDRKFARKHLRTPTMNPHLILRTFNNLPEVSHMVYPLSSFFNNVNGTFIDATLINCPLNNEDNFHKIVCSCDGILCLIQHKRILSRESNIFIQAALWNPTTGKYNVLPVLDKPQHQNDGGYVETYGFGFDYLRHKYKVVAVFFYRYDGSRGYTVYKTQVMVHTLGTHSWRLIDEFPYASSIVTRLESGEFVSGTINWLVPIDDQLIVSLDLGTESYQQILPPHYGEERVDLKLGVLRDCLCVLAKCRRRMISNIWVMKEYGNNESWTKIATLPTYITKVLYISDDYQMLLQCIKSIGRELVVYDPKKGTLKTQDVENFHDFRPTEIYVESLISPCS